MSTELGKKLKKLREEKGLTQAELAGKLGVATRQVQRYEENTIPRPNKIRALNRIFNYDFFSLLDDDFKGHKEEDKKSDQKGGKGPPEDITTLIKSNADLAASNKDLASSNLKLTNMLEGDHAASSTLHEIEARQKVLISYIMAVLGIDAENQSSVDERELLKKLEEEGRVIAERHRESQGNYKHALDKKRKKVSGH